jgi:hypoxanthine phosphoribosyltransferase
MQEVMHAEYEHLLQEILIDEHTVQARVAELGAQISEDYAGVPGLLLICVLKGGIIFLADLMRHLRVPHSIDFMAVSSYGASARESSGTVRIDMDLKQDVRGRNILVVEDIIDSGATLSSPAAGGPDPAIRSVRAQQAQPPPPCQ